MVTLVGERLQAQLMNGVVAEIKQGLEETAASLALIEEYIPAVVPSGFVQNYQHHYRAVERRVADLERFSLIIPDITQIAELCLVQLDELGEQWANWFYSKYTNQNIIDISPQHLALSEAVVEIAPEALKTISVKEAMAVHQRSRSTIYRWIKNGRLNAFKQGRLWCIIAES